MNLDEITISAEYESMREADSASEKIKKARHLMGLTQKQLADKSGLSIATIQGYEQGKYKPKFESLCKIAWALDIPLADFTNRIFDYTDKEIDESLTNLENETFENSLMKLFSKLNIYGKEKVVDYAKDLADLERYTVR